MVFDGERGVHEQRDKQSKKDINNGMDVHSNIHKRNIEIAGHNTGLIKHIEIDCRHCHLESCLLKSRKP